MTNKENSKSNHINAFIEGRKKLSNEEQVFEAGKLIREIEDVDVDHAFTTIQQRISTKGKFLKLYTIVSRYAAILLLPLVVFSVWMYLNKQPVVQPEQLTEHTISCPIGMRSQVVLPDGSKVWLNAGSTIKYRIPFVGETRNVNLEGEAFFDVIKNENAPFSVRSRTVKVNVLGTKFNFKSHSIDKTQEVALSEGSVKLAILSGGAVTSTIEMKPGDHFVFDRNLSKASVKNHNINSLIAWKDNKLIFDETPILEMEKILERWYGVEIEVTDESIESYKFTTTFADVPLQQVLNLLELSSPIKMEYIPAKLDKKSNQIINPKVKISKKN